MTASRHLLMNVLRLLIRLGRNNMNIVTSAINNLWCVFYTVKSCVCWQIRRKDSSLASSSFVTSSLVLSRRTFSARGGRGGGRSQPSHPPAYATVLKIMVNLHHHCSKCNLPKDKGNSSSKLFVIQICKTKHIHSQNFYCCFHNRYVAKGVWEIKFALIESSLFKELFLTFNWILTMLVCSQRKR